MLRQFYLTSRPLCSKVTSSLPTTPPGLFTPSLSSLVLYEKYTTRAFRIAGQTTNPRKGTVLPLCEKKYRGGRQASAIYRLSNQGDGDFEYVIRNAVEKGVKVYIISSGKKIKVAPRYSISRFSTKLRELIAEKKDSVFYVDIDLWKLKIKKDI